MPIYRHTGWGRVENQNLSGSHELTQFNTASRSDLLIRVTFVLLPRFNMMTLTGLVEPLRISNYLSPTPQFHWCFVSPDPGAATASNGMIQVCEPLSDAAQESEIIFVLGSWGSEHYVNQSLINWLRHGRRRGAALCAVELGCYILARAGLLKDRRATTHWSWAAGFQEQFPDVELEEQLYTIDGKIMTCAGGTAGLDFMLRFVAEHRGQRLAAEVADQMLHHPVRPADGPQRQAFGRSSDSLTTEVRTAIRLIESHVSEPLPVPEIAARVGVSQRQLERYFKASMGCTVVQFGQLLRLQHARVLLIATQLGIHEIAVASGFNTLSHFAHAFKKCFGRRPSEYREAWPEQDAAPSWPGTLFNFVDALREKNDMQSASP